MNPSGKKRKLDDDNDSSEYPPFKKGAAILCSECSDLVPVACINDGGGDVDFWRRPSVDFFCQKCVLDSQKQFDLQKSLQRLLAKPTDTRSTRSEVEKRFLKMYFQVPRLQSNIDPNLVKDATAVKTLQALRTSLLSKLIPLRVEGDGNCFYRAVSKGLYGSENFHLYVRLLVALEMIDHRNNYDTSFPHYCQTIVDDRIHMPPYCNLISDTCKIDTYAELIHLYAASAALEIAVRSEILAPAGVSYALNPYNITVRGRGVPSTAEPALYLLWSSMTAPRSVEEFQTNDFALLRPCSPSLREDATIQDNDPTRPPSFFEETGENRMIAQTTCNATVREGEKHAIAILEQQPLHKAAASGNPDEVTLRLDLGRRMSENDNSKQQLLRVAAENGHANVVRLLLKLGANRYAFDSTWRNSLQLAVNHNKVNVIKILLSFTPCAIQSDYYNLKALIEEKIHLVQADAVEVLLNMSPEQPVFCDPLIFSVIDNLFLTEAFCALNSRMEAQRLADSSKRLLDILIQRRLCSVNIQNLEGDTPLHEAMRMCYKCRQLKKCDKSLLKKHRGKKLKKCDKSLLKKHCGDIIVKKLLEYYVANVHQTNNNGDTALMIATKSGCDHFIRILLDWANERGIKLFPEQRNITEREGEKHASDFLRQQPLHKAASNANFEKVALQRNRGGSMSKEDSWKRLRDAAENGDENKVKSSLKLGVNRFAFDCMWRNSLQLALDHNKVNVIKILLNFTPCAIQRDECNLKTLIEEKIHMVQPDAVEVLLNMSPQLPVFCDPLIFSVIDTLFLIETFCSPNSRVEAQRLADSSKRLLNILLGTGVCSVNTLNSDGDTPLHQALRMCHECRQLKSSLKKHCGDNIVKKLLEYGANVNQQNTSGNAALYIATESRCDHFIRILLDWANENGSKLFLEQRDSRGKTALCTAARAKRIDTVKLLINNGASVDDYDNQGFTVLHALYYDRNYLFSLTCSYFTDSDNDNDASFEKIGKYIDKHTDCAGTWSMPPKIRKIEKFISRQHEKETQKLQNAKDFAGNKPRDYVEKSFVTAIDAMGRTPLHKIIIALVSERYQEEESRMTKRKKPSMLKDEIEGLHQRRENLNSLVPMKDFRGRTALHYAVMKTLEEKEEKDKLWMDILLDFVSSKDVADNYGKTPLHYAVDDEIYNWLVQHGATEQARDLGDYTPKSLKELRSKMTQFADVDIPKFNKNVATNEFTMWKLYTSLIERQRVIRRLDTIVLKKKLERFMIRLADAIGERDYRFTCSPKLVGSASDGTKSKLPGDFDFKMILTELSKQCEVHLSPVSPSGYVHIKRKRLCSKHIVYIKKDDFAILFNEEQLLLVNQVNQRFLILLEEVLQDKNVWKDEETFELCIISHSAEVINSLHKVVELRMIHPMKDGNRELYFDDLRLDIVPCICVENYWPNEALDSVNEETKSLGCHLAFCSPSHSHPWVPFAETYVIISFAVAESHKIKNSSNLLKAAYVVAKEMVMSEGMTESNEPYLLKSSFLYCIEAFDNMDYAWDSSELCEDLAGKLFSLVERILFCFAEFSDLDFLPCYFMPPFSIPIFIRLKSRHVHSYLLNGTENQFVSRAREWYMTLFPNASETLFSNSSTKPLREKFDRESFMRRLLTPSQ